MPAEYGRVRPDDLFRVLLPAALIPDGSTVTKRTGQQELVLRHQLKVYPAPAPAGQSGQPPMVLNGSYLVSSAGAINQINDDLPLMLAITAEDLHDWLQNIHEPETSQ